MPVVSPEMFITDELYLSLLEKVWRMVYGKIRKGVYVVVAVVGGDWEILK